jgi:hypothetical protein
MITWVWTRLYILPYTIWFLEFIMVPEFFSKFEHAELYISYMHAMSFFLGCLALLHYWWFFIISQMLKTILFKGNLLEIQSGYPAGAKGKEKTN